MKNVITEATLVCHRFREELNCTPEPRARAALEAEIVTRHRLYSADATTLQTAETTEYRGTHAKWFGGAPGENPVPRELHWQTREARWCRGGQWAFLLAELISGGCLAAKTLNGGLLLATLVGVALALLTAFVASAVVSRWVRHGAEMQPIKQMHRISRRLVGMGSVWLLACVTALTVLRSPDGAIGPWVFSVTMALITLLSPICSGLCGVAADLLFWSRRICRRLDAIRSLARELELLASASERRMPSVIISLVAKASTAAFVLMLFGGATCRAADLRVNVYVDVSPSARAGDARQLLKNFAGALSAYEGERPLAVSIIPFYESAFNAAVFVEVRIPSYDAPECAASNSEIIAISRAYADAQKRKCDQLQLQARKDSASSRAREISKMSAAIDRLAEVGRATAGKCTAVTAMVRRAAREKPQAISVVISDMENTCASADLPVDFRRENRVFLAPIGSRQRSIDESFESIRAKAVRTMPWAEVIESYRLQVVMDAITHPTPVIFSPY